MNKILPFCILLQIVVLASEPSVFGAGNLNSANPYGLSSSEKKIVQNIKDIKVLRQDIRTMQIKFSNLKEGFDGLRSVTESISSKIGRIDKKVFTLNEKDSNNSELIGSLKNELSTLKQSLSDNMNLQNANQAKIKSVLSELSSLIDSINTSYVSKSEFDTLAKAQKNFQISIEKKLSKLTEVKTKRNISSKNGAQLLKEANDFFNKKSYQEAKVRYERLVQINYKPARSNFKLGEIAYMQKSYKNAISYYKKSIALYDKAAYTPILLYHTGISLSKLKKNKEASNFFNALKTNYPNSKEAKSIKK